MRIAIIGGTENDKVRDPLVTEITKKLIEAGHQVYHGGINSGIMKACHEGGGIGIVHQVLVDKDIAIADATNVSLLQYQFPGFVKIDFGSAIRRQLLTKEMDLVICCDGGIGTFDELIGAIKARQKIVLVGNCWLPFLSFLPKEFGIDRKLTCMVRLHWSLSLIMEKIFAHLG